MSIQIATIIFFSFIRLSSISQLGKSRRKIQTVSAPAPSRLSMKFQTFARLILSYIVSYIVEKIDFLYSVFSGQGCGGQQTFPYRRKKIERAIFVFSKKKFFFFKKRAVTSSILFLKYFTTHIVRSLCLAKYFSTGFKPRKSID
jgi:hypothetical protein